MDTVLQPFVEELKTIGSDTGHDFQVHGGIIQLRGALLAVVADTPASNLLADCPVVWLVLLTMLEITGICLSRKIV